MVLLLKRQKPTGLASVSGTVLFVPKAGERYWTRPPSAVQYFAAAVGFAMVELARRLPGAHDPTRRQQVQTTGALGGGALREPGHASCLSRVDD